MTILLLLCLSIGLMAQPTPPLISDPVMPPTTPDGLARPKPPEPGSRKIMVGAYGVPDIWNYIVDKKLGNTVIIYKGEPLLSIDATGNVAFKPGWTPTRAARKFVLEVKKAWGMTNIGPTPNSTPPKP